jgi:hypothetical protein
MTNQNTRDSYIFYRSFYEAIKELPKENQLEIYNAIAEYSLNFKEVELSGLSKTIFTLIKPQLEANNKKYLNGSKPKQKQKISKTEAKNKQKISKTEGNVNVNVNEECIMKNENVLNEELKIKNKKTFKKPTLEQVKEYNQSRGGYVDVNKFYDYYNAGNWKDQSGNKVKNWKQKFITWENKVNKNNTESSREQHTVDLINKMMNHTLINKISLKSDKILNFHTTKENKEKLQNLPENQKQEIKSILKDNFGEKTIEFIY